MDARGRGRSTSRGRNSSRSSSRGSRSGRPSSLGPGAARGRQSSRSSSRGSRPGSRPGSNSRGGGQVPTGAAFRGRGRPIGKVTHDRSTTRSSSREDSLPIASMIESSTKQREQNMSGTERQKKVKPKEKAVGKSSRSKDSETPLSKGKSPLPQASLDERKNVFEQFSTSDSDQTDISESGRQMPKISKTPGTKKKKLKIRSIQGDLSVEKSPIRSRLSSESSDVISEETSSVSTVYDFEEDDDEDDRPLIEMERKKAVQRKQTFMKAKEIVAKLKKSKFSKAHSKVPSMSKKGKRPMGQELQKQGKKKSFQSAVTLETSMSLPVGSQITSVTKTTKSDGNKVKRPRGRPPLTHKDAPKIKNSLQESVKPISKGRGRPPKKDSVKILQSNTDGQLGHEKATVTETKPKGRPPKKRPTSNDSIHSDTIKMKQGNSIYATKATSEGERIFDSSEGRSDWTSISQVKRSKKKKFDEKKPVMDTELDHFFKRDKGRTKRAALKMSVMSRRINLEPKKQRSVKVKALKMLARGAPKKRKRTLSSLMSPEAQNLVVMKQSADVKLAHNEVERELLQVKHLPSSITENAVSSLALYDDSKNKPAGTSDVQGTKKIRKKRGKGTRLIHVKKSKNPAVFGKWRFHRKRSGGVGEEHHSNIAQTHQIKEDIEPVAEEEAAPFDESEDEECDIVLSLATIFGKSLQISLKRLTEKEIRLACKRKKIRRRKQTARKSMPDPPRKISFEMHSREKILPYNKSTESSLTALNIVPLDQAYFAATAVRTRDQLPKDISCKEDSETLSDYILTKDDGAIKQISQLKDTKITSEIITKKETSAFVPTSLPTKQEGDKHSEEKDVHSRDQMTEKIERHKSEESFTLASKRKFASQMDNGSKYKEVEMVTTEADSSTERNELEAFVNPFVKYAPFTDSEVEMMEPQVVYYTKPDMETVAQKKRFETTEQKRHSPVSTKSSISSLQREVITSEADSSTEILGTAEGSTDTVSSGKQSEEAIISRKAAVACEDKQDKRKHDESFDLCDKTVSDAKNLPSEEKIILGELAEGTEQTEHVSQKATDKIITMDEELPAVEKADDDIIAKDTTDSISDEKERSVIGSTDSQPSILVPEQKTQQKGEESSRDLSKIGNGVGPGILAHISDTCKTVSDHCEKQDSEGNRDGKKETTAAMHMKSKGEIMVKGKEKDDAVLAVIDDPPEDKDFHSVQQVKCWSDEFTTSDRKIGNTELSSHASKLSKQCVPKTYQSRSFLSGIPCQQEKIEQDEKHISNGGCESNNNSENVSSAMAMTGDVGVGVTSIIETQKQSVSSKRGDTTVDNNNEKPEPVHEPKGAVLNKEMSDILVNSQLQDPKDSSDVLISATDVIKERKGHTMSDEVQSVINKMLETIVNTKAMTECQIESVKASEETDSKPEEPAVEMKGFLSMQDNEYMTGDHLKFAERMKDKSMTSVETPEPSTLQIIREAETLHLGTPPIKGKDLEPAGKENKQVKEKKVEEKDFSDTNAKCSTVNNADVTIESPDKTKVITKLDFPLDDERDSILTETRDLQGTRLDTVNEQESEPQVKNFNGSPCQNIEPAKQTLSVEDMERLPTEGNKIDVETPTAAKRISDTTENAYEINESEDKCKKDKDSIMLSNVESKERREVIVDNRLSKNDDATLESEKTVVERSEDHMESFEENKDISFVSSHPSENEGDDDETKKEGESSSGIEVKVGKRASSPLKMKTRGRKNRFWYTFAKQQRPKRQKQVTDLCKPLSILLVDILKSLGVDQELTDAHSIPSTSTDLEETTDISIFQRDLLDDGIGNKKFKASSSVQTLVTSQPDSVNDKTPTGKDSPRSSDKSCASTAHLNLPDSEGLNEEPENLIKSFETTANNLSPETMVKSDNLAEINLKACETDDNEKSPTMIATHDIKLGSSSLKTPRKTSRKSMYPHGVTPKKIIPTTSNKDPEAATDIVIKDSLLSGCTPELEKNSMETKRTNFRKRKPFEDDFVSEASEVDSGEVSGKFQRDKEWVPKARKAVTRRGVKKVKVARARKTVVKSQRRLSSGNSRSGFEEIVSLENELVEKRRSRVSPVLPTVVQAKSDHDTTHSSQSSPEPDTGKKRKTNHKSDRLSTSFHCVLCPYYTSVKATVIEHIYGHTPHIPFQCMICLERFGTKSGTMVHHRREHKGMQPQIQKHTLIREEDFFTESSQRPQKPENLASQKEREDNKTSDNSTGSDASEISSLKQLNWTSSFPASSGQAQPPKEKKLKPRIPVLQVADPSKSYYQCRHCTFSSNEKADMLVHVSQAHSGDQRFMCPLCEVVFSRDEAGMRRHFLNSHPGEEVQLILDPDFYDIRRHEDSKGQRRSYVSLLSTNTGTSVQRQRQRVPSVERQEEAGSLNRFITEAQKQVTSFMATCNQNMSPAEQVTANIPEQEPSDDMDDRLVIDEEAAGSAVPAAETAPQDVEDSSVGLKIVNVCSIAPEDFQHENDDNRPQDEKIEENKKDSKDEAVTSQGPPVSEAATVETTSVISHAVDTQSIISETESIGSRTSSPYPEAVEAVDTYKMFRCEFCSDKFYQFEDFISHLAIKHEDPNISFKCSECPCNIFETYHAFEQHTSSVHNIAKPDMIKHALVPARYKVTQEKRKEVTQKKAQKKARLESITSKLFSTGGAKLSKQSSATKPQSESAQDRTTISMIEMPQDLSRPRESTQRVTISSGLFIPSGSPSAGNVPDLVKGTHRHIRSAQHYSLPPHQRALYTQIQSRESATSVGMARAVNPSVAMVPPTVQRPWPGSSQAGQMPSQPSPMSSPSPVSTSGLQSPVPEEPLEPGEIGRHGQRYQTIRTQLAGPTMGETQLGKPREPPPLMRAQPIQRQVPGSDPSMKMRKVGEVPPLRRAPLPGDVKTTHYPRAASVPIQEGRLESVSSDPHFSQQAKMRSMQRAPSPYGHVPHYPPPPYPQAGHATSTPGAYMTHSQQRQFGRPMPQAMRQLPRLTRQGRPVIRGTGPPNVAPFGDRPQRGPMQTPFKCPHCHVQTFSPEYLQEHIKSHVEPELFQCPYCNGGPVMQKDTAVHHLRQEHPDCPPKLKIFRPKVHTQQANVN